MASKRFPIEFHSETDGFTSSLREKTSKRLRELGEDHSDIVGAAVTVNDIAKGDEPFRFQFKVVAYIRPNRLVASEKADNVRTAMKGAMSALERQVRERRRKLKESWKRPDFRSGPEHY
jgi:ribosome-associated translation inhibitor RaiA